MIDNIINRVLDLMGKKGVTAYRVCKDNKIPYASFLQIKKGTQQFKIENIINLSEYFNVDIKYLILGKEDVLMVSDSTTPYNQRNLKSIPIVGSVGCGTSLKSWSSYGENFIDLPDTRHLNNPFVVIAKGDSMRPYINPNDKLLCADQPELIKDGKAVIVSFKTEPESSDANAKLIKFISNEMVMLYSVNTKYAPAFFYKKDIQHIYKLVRIIREVR